MSYLLETFSLDRRSLGLFRIGLGICILYDLTLLWPDIDAFFGPSSVFPASFSHWSFHGAISHPFFIYGVFIVNVLLALLLIVGYQTRLVTFLCWLMAISLAHRNPLVMYLARDYALILFLSWGMFLPLGDCFSWDSRRRQDRTLTQNTFSAASVGLICSLLMIYFLCGWLKIHPSWNQDLNALYYVFNNPDFTTRLGVYLLQFPFLLKILAWLTVFIERFGILLLLMPTKQSFFKSLLILIFTVFHLCLWGTMIVEWFALVMIVAWVALIPSSWWPQPTVPASVTINKGLTTNILGALLLLIILAGNIYNVKNFFYHSPRPTILNATQIIGLDFPWRLFAPSPPLARHQYNFTPVTENHQELPLRDYQLHEKRSYRWTFLLNNENPYLMPFLKKYLIDYWNTKYPTRPRIIDVIIEDKKEDIKP